MSFDTTIADKTDIAEAVTKWFENSLSGKS